MPPAQTGKANLQAQPNRAGTSPVSAQDENRFQQEKVSNEDEIDNRGNRDNDWVRGGNVVRKSGGRTELPGVGARNPETEVSNDKISEADNRAPVAGDSGGAGGGDGVRVSGTIPARTEHVSGQGVGGGGTVAKSATVKHKTASTALDASSSKYQDASSSKDPQVVDLADIWGIASEPVWKPKKFIRNESYPKVTATGYYFQNHSAGFVLIRRATNEYVGFYTKQAIKELEDEYGKPIRKAKSQRSSSRSAS